MKIKLSEPYLGYLDRDAIREIDKNTPMTGWVFLSCEIKKFHFTRLFRVEEECFEYFFGFGENCRDGKSWWCDLMARQIGGDVIWCVNDIGAKEDDNRVYLFHEWKGIVYHLGRIHEGHDLESACLKKFQTWKTSNNTISKC